MVAIRQFLVLLLVALNTRISSASIDEIAINGYVCDFVKDSDDFNFSCNNLKIFGKLNAKSLTIICSQPDTESKIFDFKTVPALSHLPLDEISIYACLPGNNSFSSMLNHFGVENPMSFSYGGGFYMKEALPWPLFSGLHTLESLEIASSEIAMDENIFLGFPNLKHLRLERNRVTSLHKHMFRKLENLETLALIRNEIKTIEVNKLLKLTLNGCQVQGIKESFEGHSSLAEPRLLGKEFRILSIDVFFYIPNLIYFEIDNGNPNLLNSGSLREHEVSLTDCGLGLVPKNLFANSTAMTFLNLRNNKISKLHDGLFDSLSSLQLLQLSHNKLSMISGLIFRRLYELKTLELDNNHITTIHPDAFVATKLLQHITLVNNDLLSIDFRQVFRFTEDLKALDLSNNNLKILPDLRNKSNLISLELTENNIREVKVENLPPNLRFLDLSHNKIQGLKEDICKALDKLNTTLALGNNPWSCACSFESVKMIEFIKRKNETILDLQTTKCELGIISEVSGEIFHLCSQTIKVALMIVAFLSLLICTLGISYYRHQQFIKIWLYAHMPWLWFVDDEKLERDKKYDAFISYAHEDVDLAIDTIVDELENRRANLKICLHQRDWVAGELIVDSISRSVAESRRTIIILSQNFIKSMWGQYEFNHAHQRSIAEKRVRVIVIVYGDIGRIEDLNISLQSYLKSNTYIKWGEKWFWDKLLYAIQQRA